MLPVNIAVLSRAQCYRSLWKKTECLQITLLTNLVLSPHDSFGQKTLTNLWMTMLPNIYLKHLATSDVQHVCKIIELFVELKMFKRSLRSYLLLGWPWPLQWGDGGGRGEGREGEGGKKLTFQAFLEHKDGIQFWKRELFPRGLQIPAPSSNIIVNYSHTHARTD